MQLQPIIGDKGQGVHSDMRGGTSNKLNGKAGGNVTPQEVGSFQ